MNEKPMPLRELPEYLESLREQGEVGNGMLVEMGRIQPPKSNWLKKTFFATSLIIGTIGIVTIASYQKEDTVIASTPQAEIMPLEDGTLAKEDRPKKKRRPFLEWLFNRKQNQ